MKFKITMKEGSLIPFYYGHAYRNYTQQDSFHNYEVYFIIPFNFIFKLLRKLWFWWNKVRFKRDWIDDKMTKVWREYNE